MALHHWIQNSTAYLDNYVERTDSVLSTVFIGNYFEQDLGVTSGVRTYYYLGGMRVATGNATGLYFISGDQLDRIWSYTSRLGIDVNSACFNFAGSIAVRTAYLPGTATRIALSNIIEAFPAAAACLTSYSSGSFTCLASHHCHIETTSFQSVGLSIMR